MAAFDQLELEFLDWIVNTFRNGFLDAAMPKITALGTGGWFWILVALLFMIRKADRKTGLTILVALCLSYVAANLVLKPLVGRMRPFHINTAIRLLVAAPKDFSFPSGHAQASFAAATAIYCNKKRLGVVALLLATLIAFSRLYLYLHYLSDVLAGAAIGYVLGGVADNLISGVRWRRVSRRRRRKKR